MHPMSQISMAITALQQESRFAVAMASHSISDDDMWECLLEDALNIIAKLPCVCAAVYNHTYRNDEFVPYDSSLDWAANISLMMGFQDPAFHELMRLYMVIHSDHEGGNVSAHTAHLVGSALSDPYLSLASGLNGLAGTSTLIL
jgi:citrate synthase